MCHHQGERYLLRLLLSHKAGATSYDDLKMFDGSVFPTFKATCLAMGLLEDDSELRRTLEETARFAPSKQTRVKSL